jgi:hypothetical protein
MRLAEEVDSSRRGFLCRLHRLRSIAIARMLLTLADELTEGAARKGGGPRLV